MDYFSGFKSGVKGFKNKAKRFANDPLKEYSNTIFNPVDTIKDYASIMYDPMGLWDQLNKKSDLGKPPDMPAAPDRNQTVQEMLRRQLEELRKKAGMGSELGGDMQANINPQTASQTLFGMGGGLGMGA